MKNSKLLYEDRIKNLKEVLNDASAVVIGGGSGLSTSAGLEFSGKRFEDYFSDFIQKYHFKDLYSAGFYKFASLEEFWAFWSRKIYINRYDQPEYKVYTDLYKLLKDKDYFVITTNGDHCFANAGFDEKKIFAVQGDFGLIQCSEACHNKTYDAEKIIRKMLSEQKDCRIPNELIPYCSKCGAPMIMNGRVNDKFVQDDAWYRAQGDYIDFLRRYESEDILFLELGVGYNTPSIIKYPFMRMVLANVNATYACINFDDVKAKVDIDDRAIFINMDIGEVVEELLK